MIDFFKNHVVSIRKGAGVLIERIEEYGGPTVGSPIDFSGIPSAVTVRVSEASVFSEEMLMGSGVDPSSVMGDMNQRNASVIYNDHFEAPEEDFSNI